MNDATVLVIVEHFLNEEGKNYFDRWLEEVRYQLQEYEGFQLIKRIYDPQDPGRILLYLEFDEAKKLREWSKSLDHQSILDRLGHISLRNSTRKSM